ncbi:MAG: asparagine synthase (glutamine-hydrolyzing) [Kiritimatiellales bacterium]|nr:asparagine synthase (glutamine-hydrolyzing) [Kiritimatiellales bacterium]
MCGIAGIFQPDRAAAISPDMLRAMISVLGHRGPDESGIYLDDQTGLGQTRLSIIDLSSGTQPIHNEDKTLWIVFNGEIFNYIELREKLQRKGHRFYTTTDTEVILHLYEEKGIDCLKELNGQFAFAIRDTRQNMLFLARDRVGIRPLYYTHCGPSLIFASEIKSIFMNRNVSRELDPVSMDQIFTFWSPLPGQSVFKDVHQLPPGHYLLATEGKTEVRKYWDIPFCPKADQLDWSPDLICERLQELLLDAIRIRLRADVPVGTYLSGGLDSSGITALVARNFNHDVKTFGIRFEDPAFDEGEYQQQMVAFLGTDYTELMATNAGIGESLPDVLWHCETPLLRTAPVPLFLLSRLVHDSGIKVVLTGEGADEVFGGYNIFREAAVRRFWAKNPGSQARADLIGQLYPYIFDNPRLKRMLQSFFAQGLDQTDDPLFSHLIRWENTARTKTFFSDDLRAASGSYSGYEQVREMLPPEFGSWDHLAQAQYLEMKVFMGNYLLASQGDRVAMGNSVEIRLPFLDPNLMEFMGRVPSVWKLLGLKEKYILKRSFRGILPDSVLARPKHPYRAPIADSLLHATASEQTQEMLSEGALRRNGLFNAKKVAHLIKKLQTSSEPGEVDSMALTGILSSQILHNRFVEDFQPRTDRRVEPALIIDRRSAPQVDPRRGDNIA